MSPRGAVEAVGSRPCRTPRRRRTCCGALWAVPLGLLAALLAHAVRLGTTAAVAASMAGFTTSMLRPPVASLVLVAFLLGSTGIGITAIAIVAAMPAFVVTELVDPPARRDRGVRRRSRRLTGTA